MQSIHVEKDAKETKRALYNLFAAYLHTVPLEELIESVERARLDAKLLYVVIYGAACSYCLTRAERLDGSYLRTFALELNEQLTQTLAVMAASVLAGLHRPPIAAGEAEPPFLQIIGLLQQVMCIRATQKSLRFLFSKFATTGTKKNLRSDEILCLNRSVVSIFQLR